MQLSVSQILKSDAAVFHDEGLRVFDVYHTSLQNGQNIEISFAGIRTCSTQFLNACIGKAYFAFNHDFVSQHLKITCYEQMPLFKSKLSDVIENATNYDEYTEDVKTVLA